MTVKARIQTAILSTLAVLIVVFVVFCLTSNMFNTPNRFDLVQLEEGWTVTRGENTYESVSISNSNIDIVNLNEQITMTTTLPDKDIISPTICFRSILSSVEVYYDNKLIYSFGQDYVKKGQMLPKMYNFVALPDDFKGKTLTISMTAREDNAFSGLPHVTLGNYNDIVRTHIETRRLPLVAGVYLCILGFLILILSPLLIFAQNHDYSIAFSGLVSLMLGLYILCYNDLFWYFSDQPDLYTFLEYLALFMIPASIMGFIVCAHQIKNTRIGFILTVINIGAALSTSVLHALGFIHICHFITPLHIIALAEGFFVIGSLAHSRIKALIKKEDSEQNNTSVTLLILGLIIFVVCCVIDVIKFNIIKYVVTGEINAQINFMTIGSLIFIICLLLNYFYHCIESINEAATKLQLEGLAYTDTLTNISNRSKCELSLANLKGDYTIVSIDLDYLKYTNDNYGHDAGDKLLANFSKMLKESFADASLIGRMGGDEFIIILPYNDTERTEGNLTCLKDLLNAENKKGTNIRYSASFGYADSASKELPPNHNAKDVYLLADAKMYIMKKAHHAETLGRLYSDLFKDMAKEGGEHEA